MHTAGANAAGTAAGWAGALAAATDAVTKYGGAGKGSRTMLDALIPASEVLAAKVAGSGGVPALKEATAAADAGAVSTGSMVALAGRSTYIDPAKLQG